MLKSFLCTILLGVVFSLPAYSQNIAVSILPLQGLVDSLLPAQERSMVLVKPGQSPAMYDLQREQLQQLQKAKILFTIGVPFEKHWVPKIQKRISTLKIVPLHFLNQDIPMEAHHHGDENHADEHNHDHGDHKTTKSMDPHIWTSPAKVIGLIQTITYHLIQQYPKHRTYILDQSQRLIQKYQELDQQLAKKLAPLKGKRFMVFHPSWGYFAQHYGLIQEAIEADGKSPSPKELSALIQRAKQENIQAIFVQKQFDQSVAKSISEQLRIPVITVNPLRQNIHQSLSEMTEAMTAEMAKGLAND